MTPFFAGTLFGGLFVGALFLLFLTRLQRPREVEKWEAPFDDQAQVQRPIRQKLIRERIYQL